jgi:hypothetical protein
MFQGLPLIRGPTRIKTVLLYVYTQYYWYFLSCTISKRLMEKILNIIDYLIDYTLPIISDNRLWKISNFPSLLKYLPISYYCSCSEMFSINIVTVWPTWFPGIPGKREQVLHLTLYITDKLQYTTQWPSICPTMCRSCSAWKPTSHVRKLDRPCTAHIHCSGTLPGGS